MVKLTENEVIDNLCEWLAHQGWEIQKKSKNHERGIDIKASKDNELLIIEAKGSKGNSLSHVTKRKKFDSGQIKDHFGKALVKVLEERNRNPNATIAIAQPNDIDIRRNLKDVIPEAKKIGIKLFWVDASDKIEEE
jgi:hypothetical protein